MGLVEVRGVDGSEAAIPRGRLLGWFVLVGLLTTLAYAARLAEKADKGTAGGEDKGDLLYEWSTAIGAVVQYGIILAVVLALMRGVPRRLLGLGAPRSWGEAAGLVVAGWVGIAVVGVALDKVLKAGEEQGLVPDAWDPSRAAPFVANFVVVAGVAPIVEELTYRGLGFSALRTYYGAVVAVVVSALAFGLSHGLLVALPVLTLFGVVLALVRLRTESIYPAIILHAVFNGIALIGAVTIGLE